MHFLIFLLYFFAGIGDLIIDLDADIEKSSNVESSLMIPLQKLADQSKLVDSNLSNCSSSSGQIGRKKTLIYSWKSLI